MRRSLVFRAGKNALSLIRENGLCADMVKVALGAAGGPKWLVLGSLDRAVFGSWFRHRTYPLFLLGSSIGAWRLAAGSLVSPAEAVARLQEAYTHQHFSSGLTPKEVTLEAVKILNNMLGDKGPQEILGHPYMRLNLVAARCKWPVAGDHGVVLGMGLMNVALYNVFHRKGLKYFFERTLFYDPREVPPFTFDDGFPVFRVPLSAQNLKHALLASASIPLVMLGIRNIPGAPRGVYRDGGVIDYHFDLSFMKAENEIALFPHYVDRIIPGWFDQKLAWRRPQASNLDGVVLVAPSRAFTGRLPLGKIPDRNDFRLFRDRDEDRIDYWNAVVKACAHLGEEFLETVETGKVRELVEAMP